ncbi:MAG TPA: RnfH family protein [Steroidobacteraceae bacterium]
MSEAAPRSKRCWVAYANRDRQYLWELELPIAASVADALLAARRACELGGESASIPWDEAPVGIFGEPCDRSATPREGDRIELYRPLTNDPKQARRARARRRR